MTTETYNENGVQYIIEPLGERFSTHYGEAGGGYGYYTFHLEREIGHDYLDIGFGYEIIRRKRLRLFQFHGQIRQIEEVSSPKGDRINITALGFAVIAQDDELLRAFCDKRLNMWKTNGEVPIELYRPDLFGTGSNALGLFMHASTKEADTNAYTELKYNFNTGEIAERVKVDLSMMLGTGVLFDGTVSSIDIGNSYVFYTNDAGEGNVQTSMILVNLTKNTRVTISAIDTGLNRFTVNGTISSWVATDELTVYGPLFSSQVSDITNDVITYMNDLGEGNLVNGQMIANVSQKAVATIQSFNAGANTITVTDEAHITGWAINDVLYVPAAIFEAQVSSVASTTITYSSAIGERIASSATGWVLHNETRSEFAIVDSWNIASSQVDVTIAGDISAWVATNVIKIYAAYSIEIVDSNDTTVWPTDWREGAVPQNRTAINELTAASPTSFSLKFKGYLGGSGADTSFAQMSNLRVYSTEDDITVSMLAENAVSVLSGAGHGLNSSTDDIEAITHIIEPMVHEFVRFNEALAQACSYGDDSFNPLAWGIKLDDTKTLYLETQDQATVDYRVRRTAPVDMSMAGDIQPSAQKVRAAYADKLGRIVVTDWIEDTDARFSGHYRVFTLRLSNIDTATEADSLVQKYLDENKKAKRQARYSAKDGSMFLETGAPVPFDEIQATGRMIEIEDWRAVETGVAGTDLGSSWAIEQLVGVEIDIDANTANLIPGSAKATFERYMAELARMATL